MFNWFRKKKEPEAPVARVEPLPPIAPFVVTAQMVARSNQKRKPLPAVFSSPSHPPSVATENLRSSTSRLAMDSSIGDVQNWGNSQLAMLSGVWDEGVTFLGYAYLAELSQRPEYRVMSETIASEMTRMWIRFTSTNLDGDDEDKEKQEAKEQRIKELEAEFKRLDVVGMFRKATEQDGYFGRGHIYIDTGDTDNPEELLKSIGDGRDEISHSKINKGSVKKLRTVEAVWCYPTSYNSNNPLADDWYRPNEWYVQSQKVHSSRLITLVGREVSDLLKPTYSFGGLSMSQMAKPYVDNWLQTRQSVNAIISAFVTWVLKTNMGVLNQLDGEALFNRADMYNNLRDNRGLMMIDKDTEEFANVSAPLGGLSELQAQAQEHMASVSHIPLVKLTGISPQGLNASSEGEIRSFYDWINSFQEKLYRKPIHRLMGLVMLSLWDEIDEDIDFEFEPLWSLDEKGMAEVEKTKAETDQILIDVGSISPEESRKRVAASEGSGYSSIDVEDVPDLQGEEEEGLEPMGGRPNPVEDPNDKKDPEQDPEDEGQSSSAVVKGKGGKKPPADKKPQAQDESQWDESKHPRAANGQFGSGSSGGGFGGGGGSTPKPTPSVYAPTSKISAGIKSAVNQIVGKVSQMGFGHYGAKSGSYGNVERFMKYGTDLHPTSYYVEVNKKDGSWKAWSHEYSTPAGGHAKGEGQGFISFMDFLKSPQQAPKPSEEVDADFEELEDFEIPPKPEKPDPASKSANEIYDHMLASGWKKSEAGSNDKLTKFDGEGGTASLLLDKDGNWSLATLGHMSKKGTGVEALNALMNGSMAEWKAAGVVNGSLKDSAVAPPSPSPQHTTPPAEALRQKLASNRPKPTSEELNAIGIYKGSGYTGMNSVLRKGQSNYKTDALKQWLEKSSLIEDTTVYRGIKADYAEVLLSIIDDGSVFRDRGFISTTTSEQFAKDWKRGNSQGVLMTIRAKKGQQAATIRDAGTHDGEYELLLQSDTRLRVLSYDLTNRTIECEMVQPFVTLPGKEEPEGVKQSPSTAQVETGGGNTPATQATPAPAPSVAAPAAQAPAPQAAPKNETFVPITAASAAEIKQKQPDKPVTFMRNHLNANPNLPRKDAIAYFVSKGINKQTAQTQYTKWMKSKADKKED